MSEAQETKEINWVMGAYCLMSGEDAERLSKEYAEYRDATHEKGEPLLPVWLYFKNRIQVTIKEEDSAQ
jgi:hypothetical protein